MKPGRLDNDMGGIQRVRMMYEPSPYDKLLHFFELNAQ